MCVCGGGGTPHELTFVRLHGLFWEAEKWWPFVSFPPPPPQPTLRIAGGHRLRAEFGMNINHDAT